MMDEKVPYEKLKQQVEDLTLQVKMLKYAESEKKRLESCHNHLRKTCTLGTMAAGFAHDFNNILNPMILHAEILKMDMPAEDEKSFSVEEILSSGKRAKKPGKTDSDIQQKRAW